MFLTYDRVFPSGAHEQDLLRIYRPRPGLPFTRAALESAKDIFSGRRSLRSRSTSTYSTLRAKRISRPFSTNFKLQEFALIRLDAVGYAIKKPGTSCFMIPETFRFIESLTS